MTTALLTLLLLAPGDSAPWTTHADLVAAEDHAAATELVETTRARGQDALYELFSDHDRLTVRYDRLPADAAARESLAREIRALREFIDAVGGQRYCTDSRLYWHTDLESAQEAARASGKPILSLRMLGRLTDELSCANSRFFRTTLYANEGIAKTLRQRFVLHWESVRPVPVITVDFGDGRKLVRTITGNSAHYVLDADGRPLDALPGLYSPAAFADWLARMEVLHATLSQRPAAERSQQLVEYHQQRAQRVKLAWLRDLDAVGVDVQSAAVAAAVRRSSDPNTEADTSAKAAVALTATKAPTEALPTAWLTMSRDDLSNLTTDEVWAAVAALHQGEAVLDDASRQLIARENPTAGAANERTMTKRLVETNILAKLLEKLETNVALDTVRNEYGFHQQIHEWFVEGAAEAGVDPLNKRVYAELFLTPDSDPWLGLVESDVYTGLTDAGIVVVQ